MGDRRPSRADKETSTGPKALPWGMDKAEMQPGSFASLTDDKLARFVIGQQKKTKFAKVCRHKSGQAETMRGLRGFLYASGARGPRAAEEAGGCRGGQDLRLFRGFL